MAIMAILTVKGLSKEIYEQNKKEVQWDVNPPAGQILHCATFDSTGQIHVVDIWESEDAMNTFFKTRLKPAFEKHGIGLPQGQIFPVHALHALPVISEYIVGEKGEKGAVRVAS